MSYEIRRFCVAFFSLVAVFGTNVASGQQNSSESREQSFTYPTRASTMDPLAYLECKQKALSLVQASKWHEADDALEPLVQAYPYDGEIWRDLGTVREHLGQDRKAAAGFVNADRLGLSSGADYNAADAARAFANADDKREALSWLETALGKYTYRDPGKLLAERTFDGLRGMAEFQALSPSAALPANSSRREELNADLNYYLQQYAKYRFPKLTQGQINTVLQAGSALRKRLNSLSDDELVVEFQRLAAAAPGGHNYTTLGKGPGGVRMLSLPIDMYLFPEGLFVIGSADPRYDHLVGTRVSAFGPLPEEEMMRRVAPLIDRDLNADSNVAWHAPQYLGQLAVLHYLGATPSASWVELTLRDNRHEETVVVEGIANRDSPKLYPSRTSASAVPLALARVHDNYWFTDLSPQTAYVQFNQVINKVDESLMEFGIRLRKHLAAAGTENLIVDARFNGGGNTFEYLELLRTLIAFDAQEGHHLYYVEGRATFSAAVNFTTEVRTLTHATFVGEPANAPRAAGDPVDITLPNTGIEVRFSTDTWSLYYPDDTRCWITPDMPVTLTAKDYFANRDPVLSAIQQAIAHESRPPSL